MITRPGSSVQVYRIMRAEEPDANTAADTIVDTEGHAYRAYDVADGTMVLVRPDGYIGLITVSAASVAEYLRCVAVRDCA